MIYASTCWTCISQHCHPKPEWHGLCSRLGLSFFGVGGFPLVPFLCAHLTQTNMGYQNKDRETQIFPSPKLQQCLLLKGANREEPESDPSREQAPCTPEAFNNDKIKFRRMLWLFLFL